MTIATEASSTDLVHQGAALPLTEDARRRFSQESIDLISATLVPPRTSRGTLMRFLEISARYELDPYLNEIWCALMTGRDGQGGRVAVLIGRDGYLRVANRQDDFIDVDSDVVYSKDEFRVARKADGTRSVEHSYGNPAERGEAMGAYAVLRRKNRPDRYFYAPLDQYGKNPDRSAWKYRDAMLVKAAMSYILRITYSITGAVPADEIGAGLALDGPAAGGAAAGGPPQPLPERIRGKFEEAHSIDPRSWRENEVRARVFGRDGEELADQVRKVEGELDEWLAENRGADAEVVEDDPIAATAEEADELAALAHRYLAAGKDDAPDDEREWRVNVDDLLEQRLSIETQLSDVRSGGGENVDRLNADVEVIDAKLAATGIPAGWLPPSDDPPGQVPAF